jgi:hypothetical protein
MGTYEWKPFTLLVSAEEVKVNEMTKFSVGQRIKLKEGSPEVEGQFTHGKDYIVRSMLEGRKRIEVEKDDSGDENGWMSEYFTDYKPSPIRIVTRREIVPGVYGRIKITGTYQGNRVTMDWDRNDIITAAVPIVGMSAEELREAAHLFNQLAEALEENGK